MNFELWEQDVRAIAAQLVPHLAELLRTGIVPESAETSAKICKRFDFSHNVLNAWATRRGGIPHFHKAELWSLTAFIFHRLSKDG